MHLCKLQDSVRVAVNRQINESGTWCKNPSLRTRTTLPDYSIQFPGRSVCMVHFENDFVQDQYERTSSATCIYSQNRLRFYAAALPRLQPPMTPPRPVPSPVSRSTPIPAKSSSAGTWWASTQGAWGCRTQTAPVCSPWLRRLRRVGVAEAAHRRHRWSPELRRHRTTSPLQKLQVWSTNWAGTTKTRGPSVSFFSWTSTIRTPSWCFLRPRCPDAPNPV